MEYYSYRLMVRNSLSPLHLSGQLFHQYAVGMHVCQDRAVATELHRSKSEEDSSRSILWLG